MTTREKETKELATRNLSCRFFVAPALLVESPKARCRQHPV
jgi:hypothetical protein